MEIIISLVFMGLFSLASFLPFIIIIIVIIKGVKNGKVKVETNSYKNNTRNTRTTKYANSKQVLRPGENYRVEKLQAPMQNNDEHNHSYVHKVEPIDEISVMNDENSTIAMLNQKREETAKENRIDDMRSDYLDRNAAKNADIHTNMSYGEKKVICKYCGAENVVAKGENKTCYFCREKL